VKESVKKNPNDYALRELAKQKRLDEAGLPDPGEYVDSLAMYRSPMGDAVKTRVVHELDDHWYQKTAHNICKSYGGNLEAQWEEVAASNYARGHFATNGVKVDRDKLLQAIKDCLEERDDMLMGEGVSLKEMARRLRSDLSDEIPVMPIIESKKDPVKDLLESNFGSSVYIAETEALFAVRKSYLPAGIKKYRLGEGSREEVRIPVTGQVPGGSIGPNEERALDKYVDLWNSTQARKGEPYKLSWNPHPSGINLVGFNLELK
jgi:hypothetical protein